MTDARRVLTIGTFDIFHAGHVNLLAEAAKFGELYVGVNSGDFVESYKGKRPVFTLTDRCRTVAALPFVQRVFVNEDAGFTLIFRVQPQVIVIGSDWHERDYLVQIGMTQQDIDKHGIVLAYVPYTDGVSTTLLRERLGC